MSSLSTRSPYAAAFYSSSLYGGNAPPMVDGLTVYGGDFISSLSQIKSFGARAGWMFVDGSPFYKGVNSEFSLAMWKNRMDLAAAKTSAQQIHNFYLDGTLFCNYMLDDFQSGSPVFPGGVPSGADLDEMARYSRSLWSMLPTMVRGNNTYLQGIAPGGSYKTLDFAVCQLDSYPTQGPAQTFYQNNINAGKACGLGTMAAINLLDGGSGITAPWNTHPNRTTNFGMSPQEIRACGTAFSALTELIGIHVWAYRSPKDSLPTYYNDPAINAALTDVANAAVGRQMGPINFHGATSSVSTVVGQWQLVNAGNDYRTGDSASVTVTAPTGLAAGNLSLMAAYSRDSGRLPAQPSGWSTAKSISGNSAQGGALALYYQIATGNEVSQKVTFTGAGGSGAVMARWWPYSGNTQAMAGLLNATGSARSWSNGTSNMGPVPGVTPTSAGCLVVIVAAKTNDFNQGNTPVLTTLSATTNDGESWNRAWMNANLSGSQTGAFSDYAFLTGAQSITTKSWSATTQSTSATSGAGCGFMVAFAPAIIQVGTPPTVTLLQDVSLSVGSTLSFTATSTGSTPITWSCTSGPSTITMGSGGTFLWTPASSGSFVVVLQATNSIGTDADEFIISVTQPSVAGNAPPVITNPGSLTVLAQDRLSFIVAATDADNDPIEFSLAASAPSGTFIDRTTGQFTWTPTGAQGPGTYPIVAIASDGQVESRSTFTVTVLDVPWTRDGGPSTQFGRTNPAGNSFRRI